MGRLVILLCDAPFQSERVEHSIRIAEAALAKGHNVFFYLFMDGVYNVIKSQDGNAFRMRPISDRFSELIAKGAHVSCCKLCMDLRGVKENMIPQGVKVTGLAELSAQMAEADSLVSFTGAN